MSLDICLSCVHGRGAGMLYRGYFVKTVAGAPLTRLAHSLVGTGLPSPNTKGKPTDLGG